MLGTVASGPNAQQPASVTDMMWPWPKQSSSLILPRFTLRGCSARGSYLLRSFLWGSCIGRSSFNSEICPSPGLIPGRKSNITTPLFETRYRTALFRTSYLRREGMPGTSRPVVHQPGKNPSIPYMGICSMRQTQAFCTSSLNRSGNHGTYIQ